MKKLICIIALAGMMCPVTSLLAKQPSHSHHKKQVKKTAAKPKEDDALKPHMANKNAMTDVIKHSGKKPAAKTEGKSNMAGKDDDRKKPVPVKPASK